MSLIPTGTLAHREADPPDQTWSPPPQLANLHDVVSVNVSIRVWYWWVKTPWWRDNCPALIMIRPAVLGVYFALPAGSSPTERLLLNGDWCEHSLWKVFQFSFRLSCGTGFSHWGSRISGFKILVLGVSPYNAVAFHKLVSLFWEWHIRASSSWTAFFMHWVCIPISISN